MHAVISGLLASGGKVGEKHTESCRRTRQQLSYEAVTWRTGIRSSPGTTSLASNASSYSMKPKPFMSLISVMFPVPSLKWVWMSSFVTVVVVVSESRQRR